MSLLQRTPSLRTLLVLGRVSNLPTVWSNCLAGWWLGGGGHHARLPFLLLGVTLLYVGGMFLNDAFDAEFDRHNRKERPIPSGAIACADVWKLGILSLVLGAACLSFLGLVSGGLGLALVLCIVAYDALHKLFTFSPILMGGCRFFVYVLAASVGNDGVTGWAVWCGIALGTYVIGLSGLARKESLRGSVPRWPLLLLALPLVLALLINDGIYREGALIRCIVVALWILYCLRATFWTANVNIGRTVSGLLAGIVIVDWLAIMNTHTPPELAMILLFLFLTALLSQRLAPAT
ncbi:MAG: UbiA family prenyltransferase [Verrucomicrobia bacterium]|nr:UbiA family prenyltransferase [Verrucomicrobiota bacterium]